MLLFYSHHPAGIHQENIFLLTDFFLFIVFAWESLRASRHYTYFYQENHEKQRFVHFSKSKNNQQVLVVLVTS